MATAPIGDRLIRALATIDELQEAIGKHAQILSKIAGKMAEMDKRLTAVEKAVKSRAMHPIRNGGAGLSLSAWMISIDSGSTRTITSIGMAIRSRFADPLSSRAFRSELPSSRP